MLTSTPFNNKTTQKVLAGFIALFNNIQIQRPDASIYKVPLKYGGRSKYLKFIQGAKDVEYTSAQFRRMLPVMTFQIIDIEYDPDRQHGKTVPLRIIDPNDANAAVRLFQPVPYNITIEMTIIARKATEAFQVFEQIIPYFQPDFTVNIKPIEGVSTHVDDIPFKILSSTIVQDSEDDTTIDEVEFQISFMAPVKYYSQVKTRKVIKIVEIDDILSDTKTTISVDPITADVDDDWVVQCSVAPLV